MELNISRLVEIAKIVIDEVLACSKNIEAMQGRTGVYVCVADTDGITRALMSVGNLPSREKRRKYSMIAQKKCYDLALLGRMSAETTRAYADDALERYVGGIVGCDFLYATSGFTGDLDEVCSLAIAVGMGDVNRDQAFITGRLNPHQAILLRVLDVLAGYP